MDSFHADAVKLEKVSAIRRYRQLQKVSNLFRVIEICVILVIISKFSSQLPLLIKSSSVYFKDLFVVLVSPRFVFLIGNAIILTLFVKSGHFSAKDSASKNGGFDVYKEFVEKSVKSGNFDEDGVEKQSICEEKLAMVDTYTTTTTTSCTTAAALDKKIYRTKSEKLKSENCEKGRRMLRRTATEGCKENMGSGEKSEKHSYAADNLSNEEFKRTVEAFIARQQRFLREEEDYSAFEI